MFLLSQIDTTASVYRINLDDNVISEITKISNFYLEPDEVAGYSFVDNPEESIQVDTRVKPVYKFLCDFMDRTFNIRKYNLVDFQYSGSDEEYRKIDSTCTALINLSSSEENNSISFYKWNRITEEPSSQEVEPLDAPPSEQTPAQGGSRDYISFPSVIDENTNIDAFYNFDTVIGYNEIIIYDSSVFHIESNMTKYQVLQLY